MNVTLLLADYAAVAEGKLTIVGGGWSLTGPDPMPSAVAALIKVPWDQANQRHHLRLELLDADGQPVEVPAPDGSQQPLIVEGEFEVGRPPGLKPGTPIDLPWAVCFGPLPLPADSRFVWRFSVDGQSDEDWSLAFSTRPQIRRAA